MQGKTQQKIFVTGANGQLGRDLIAELTKRGYECVCSDLGEVYSGPEHCDYVKLDITDYDSVEKSIRSANPASVIHCAAWTAVDAAEDESNKNIVWAVNVTGTENIAKACRSLDCTMTYISTDYVFNGEGNELWSADEKNFAPLNYYGLTKLEGERAVSANLEKFFIVRTAWVFGIHGMNFVRTMLNLAKSHDVIRVVNDQVGTPTYTPDLSRLLVDMVSEVNVSEKFGIYHVTNEGGYISWYDFACEIFRQAGIKNVNVMPVSTLEYARSSAKRPFNSRLDRSKLARMGFKPLPTWQNALSRYLECYDGTD